MKLFAIRIHVPDVLYDIRNKAWLTARARDTGNNYKQVAYMKPDSEGGDSAQLLRAVTSAWRRLKPLFAEYLQPGESDTQDDAYVATASVVDAQDDLTELLYMPETFNEAVCDTVVDTIHKYLVSRSLGEWMRLNVAADADTYLSEAEVFYQEIWASLGQRIRPSRPKEATLNLHRDNN